MKFLFIFQLDVLFGNLTEMVEFQVEFLKTLEDGVRLVPDLEKLERVDQFKVSHILKCKSALMWWVANPVDQVESPDNTLLFLLSS